MRETVAAVVISALLGVACEARTSSSSPAAGQAASPAAPAAAAAPARAATPAESSKPERKAGKSVRIARARTAKKAITGVGKKLAPADAAEPSAPAVLLTQSPPSSY